jgi:Fe-S-cluster containining protein
VLRRCTVYEARPLICRVYGAAEGLRCPHGCTPERVVPDVEVFEMLERVEAL